MDETLLCGVPCLVLPWDKGREGGENHMTKDLDGAFLRFCVLLSQLVALSIAHRKEQHPHPILRGEGRTPHGGEYP